MGDLLRVYPPPRPARVAVVALFSFLNVWNDFIAPLVYLQPGAIHAGPRARSLHEQNRRSRLEPPDGRLNVRLSTHPYPFFLTHRTFIEGIATTGGK